MDRGRVGPGGFVLAFGVTEFRVEFDELKEPDCEFF